MSPLETVTRWFEAFASDPEAARALWSEEATLHAADGGFESGFDDLLSWYARRREREGPGFSWSVEDLLGGERYAAAVLRLMSEARPAGWVQHAVYDVRSGVIREVWLHEFAGPEAR